MPEQGAETARPPPRTCVCPLSVPAGPRRRWRSEGAGGERGESYLSFAPFPRVEPCWSLPPRLPLKEGSEEAPLEEEEAPEIVGGRRSSSSRRSLSAMSILRRRSVFPRLTPPRGPFELHGAGLEGATDDDVEALVEAERLLLDAFPDVRGDGFRFPQG